MSKTIYNQMIAKNTNSEFNVCADCSEINPTWASINHGTLLCDQCAIIHRSLGRIISQIKPLNATNWKQSQLQMVLDLYRNGSNSIWEHTLLDPHLSSTSGHHHHHHYYQQSHNKLHQRKKPQSNDPIYPNKNDFIRAKYQSFAFVNKSHGIIKDDLETESDISEQLHSSVRTPNLKTSLRLLVAGANPNYIHTEKSNSPLHMAARSGQISQIELLLAYGANSAVVDSRNKSPIDYARDAGHHDIVYRLIEHQFDMIDTFTCFLSQGRQPNHRNGEHFLFIDLKSDSLHNQSNNSDGNKNFNDDNRPNSIQTFRSELYQCLQSLNNKLFHELTRDIYDELDRREINTFVVKNYSNENGKLSLIHQQLIIPFLPVYQYFSTTRNQERQKLALLNMKELTLLIVDVLNEMRRRLYNIQQNQIGNNENFSIELNDNEDSEPLYDSVPSEEDYDDLNYDDELNTIVKKQPTSSNQQQQQQSKSIEKPKDENNQQISSHEYNTLKEQIIKSTELMEVFLNENKTMRQELNRLQSKLDKLTLENVQLKQMFLQPTSLSIPPQSSMKSASMLIESSLDDTAQVNTINNNNLLTNSFLQNQTSSTNRVRPQSMQQMSNDNNSLFFINNQPKNISAHNYNIIYNSNNNNNSDELHHCLYHSPSPLSSHHLQQHQQQQQQIASSSSSSFNRSSPSPSPNSQYPNMNEIIRPYSATTMTSTTTATTIQSLSKSSALRPSAAAATAATKDLPTKDEVIRKIEFITYGIKELLIKAKEEKHNEFHHCSERICNYVSDMINLFPESIETSNMDNLFQLNQAFIQLQGNVIHLNELCHSYENRSKFNHHQENILNGNNNRYNNYNKVIDKAAEVASSVKSIINLYNIQTTAAAAPPPPPPSSSSTINNNNQ